MEQAQDTALLIIQRVRQACLAVVIGSQCPTATDWHGSCQISRSESWRAPCSRIGDAQAPRRTKLQLRVAGGMPSQREIVQLLGRGASRRADRHRSREVRSVQNSGIPGATSPGAIFTLTSSADPSERMWSAHRRSAKCFPTASPARWRYVGAPSECWRWNWRTTA